MPTDPNKVFPPIPAGFSVPFYYSSVNAIWVYYKVRPDKVAPYFENIALDPALFDGEALVLLHFQRYTGFLSSALSAVNEVQLCIMAYPTVLGEQTPAISLTDFLAGGEQTKTIGAYRLWVPADNKFAVPAGKELFYEPTFLTTFTYQVPAINAPGQQSWDVTCNDPDNANEFIFSLHADPPSPDATPSAMSPIMQYTRDPQGHVFAYTWNVFGAFANALLNDDGGGITLKFGESTHPMRAEMQALIDGVPAVGIQTFATPPVGTSTRGFLIQPET